MSEISWKDVEWAKSVFGLGDKVSFGELQQKYRKLCQKHHPDKGGTHQKMSEINEAYEILTKFVTNYPVSLTEKSFEEAFPENAPYSRFFYNWHGD